MNKDKVLDCLVEARARIAEPCHWTIGALARSSTGRPVFPTSPKAVRWCAGGSVQACKVDLATRNAAIKILNKAAGGLGIGASIVRINDQERSRPTVHHQVLGVFDEAIRRRRAEWLTEE